MLCECCKKDWPNKTCLRRHLNAKKFTEPKEKEIHKCESCYGIFPTRQSLERHTLCNKKLAILKDLNELLYDQIDKIWPAIFKDINSPNIVEPEVLSAKILDTLKKYYDKISTEHLIENLRRIRKERDERKSMKIEE